jgi:hypothetical protein
MWEALDDANGELQWKLDEFINKFIYFPPDKSKQQQFNLFIDMLGIFFSVFSAPFFNHGTIKALLMTSIQLSSHEDCHLTFFLPISSQGS